MTDEPGWDPAGLRARCESLREILQDLPHVASQDLADYWPGGAENHEAPPGDWIFCYAQLIRMLGYESPETEAQQQAEAERAVLEALRRVPVTVPLVTPLGERTSLLVYPKSLHALLHIEARDYLLGCLVEATNRLSRSAASTAAERFPPLADEIGYQQRVMVWILTTEGPGLPFMDEDSRPEPPESLRAIDAADVVRVLQAHRQIHLRRSALVGSLLTPSKSKHGRASWAVLSGSAATRLGISTYELLRDLSLGEWLAQLAMTSESERPSGKEAA